MIKDSIKVKKDTRIKKGEVRNPNGRPKGSKNRFTKVKESIVRLYDDCDLEAKLKRKLASSEQTDNYADVHKFIKDIVIPVLPKQSL